MEASVQFNYIDGDFRLADEVDFVSDHMDRFQIEDINGEDHNSQFM